jgi:hypothetical protein
MAGGQGGDTEQPEAALKIAQSAMKQVTSTRNDGRLAKAVNLFTNRCKAEAFSSCSDCSFAIARVVSSICDGNAAVLVMYPL